MSVPATVMLGAIALADLQLLANTNAEELMSIVRKEVPCRYLQERARRRWESVSLGAPQRFRVLLATTVSRDWRCSVLLEDSETLRGCHPIIAPVNVPVERIAPLDQCYRSRVLRDITALTARCS